MVDCNPYTSVLYNPYIHIAHLKQAEIDGDQIDD